MVNFLDEITTDCYGNLLDTSDTYKNDVENLNMLMNNFAGDSSSMEDEMNEIKRNVNNITIAVEESANGVVNTTEMSVDLTNHVGTIQSEAEKNMNVSDFLDKGS